MSQVAKAVRKHPIVAFYVLAFTLSWLGRVPLALSSHELISLENPLVVTFLFLLGGAAPTLAAVITAYLAEGKGGVDDLFGRFKRRAGLKWYLIALLLPFVVMLIGFGVDAFFISGQAPNWGLFDWVGLPFLFGAMFISYVWEEIGWRGFALPKMQERLDPLMTSLIMGALWYLWHLPLMLNRDVNVRPSPIVELFFMLALTVLYTWLYNNSGGSLLIASVLHAALNTTAGISIAIVGEDGFSRQYAPVTVVYVIIAVALVLALGRELGRKVGDGLAEGESPRHQTGA